MDYIESKTFDEIQVGDTEILNRTLTTEDLSLFSTLSGSLHFSADDNSTNVPDSFHQVVGGGLWVVTLVTHLIGNQLPGPGTVYKAHNLHFVKTVRVGDQISMRVTVQEKQADNRVLLGFTCINQLSETVGDGTIQVVAPTVKQRVPILEKAPHIRVPARAGSQLQRLIAMTHDFAPIRMAIVHPTDSQSLMGAIEAARANLIVPVIFGPLNKIRPLAEKEGVDLALYEVIDTEHSHAAAEQSVAAARSGQVEAILKGNLHTDELMAASVQRGTGISTSRRMSHVFVLDVPTYPRPLLVTDAAINIDPSLEEKRDIVQNAIDLAHALGLARPKVALLSAVETVSPKMRSTLEAAAICKMADRHQITGGIIDGPLAFDNAVSEKAANIKGIISPVAGNADILVAPDLEAGNMVAKQLEYMAEAQSSGIVLGARVPIALTSRADSVLSRMASCALALLLVRNKKR